jgi:hypothetical protein
MSEPVEQQALNNIGHFIQAGFLALVAVAEQIRDGKQGSPTPAELEDAADLLRRASASLGGEP